MGYRWGYAALPLPARYAQSITCDRLRIRPGEPSKDVRGLPGTSAKVQRISAHLAQKNRYVFRQHPGTSADSQSFVGGISGGIATRSRIDTPTHSSKKCEQMDGMRMRFASGFGIRIHQGSRPLTRVALLVNVQHQVAAPRSAWNGATASGSHP